MSARVRAQSSVSVANESQKIPTNGIAKSSTLAVFGPGSFVHQSVVGAVSVLYGGRAVGRHHSEVDSCGFSAPIHDEHICWALVTTRQGPLAFNGNAGAAEDLDHGVAKHGVALRDKARAKACDSVDRVLVAV